MFDKIIIKNNIRIKRKTGDSMYIKKNNLLILAFLSMILIVSVGYATLNSTIKITGNSEVKQNTWDIHFENLQIINGSEIALTSPSLDNKNLTINFEVNLEKPVIIISLLLM